MRKMIETETTMAVEKIAKGEFVRRLSTGTPNAKTYQRGDFCRATQRYSLVDCADTNREVFVKRGTQLFVGFCY